MKGIPVGNPLLGGHAGDVLESIVECRCAEEAAFAGDLFLSCVPVAQDVFLCVVYPEGVYEFGEADFVVFVDHPGDVGLV